MGKWARREDEEGGAHGEKQKTAKSAPKALGMAILAPPIAMFRVGRIIWVWAATWAGSVTQASRQASSASGAQGWGPERAMSRAIINQFVYNEQL
jgi:hypothetical protein